MTERSAGKLYINGRFLVHKPTGVQRFAWEVVQALDRLLGESPYADLRGRVALVTPAGAGLPAPLAHIDQIEGGVFGAGYMWEQFDLFRMAAHGVLLSLCNLGPVTKRRQVVVMHDAATRAMPHAFSRAFRIAYGVLMPALARRARQLATVSEFSRSEIARWFGVPRDRLSVCHEGAEHILSTEADTAVLERHGLARNDYFLAVGMGPANKNQQLMLGAYAATGLDNVKLVLTGRRSARVHGAAALQIPEGTLHVGHVSDAELRALYEHALALVFPSNYEGFGLPPIEAMACGCPVIISDQPALLEVAGGAAYVIGMGDTEGLAAALRQVATDPDLRNRLSQAGFDRARHFTWRATACRLLLQCQAAA